MSPFRAVGIDLGTTYSCVAERGDDGRTTIVLNQEGDILTPSVVYFDDREVLVGKEARKAGALKTDRLAECVKRDMGNPVYSRAIRGEFLPPEVIQSYILKKLKQDTARRLGPGFKAVITVPAFFDEPRRAATANAAELAGIELLDIVNEPTAAALAFGEELGYLTAAGTAREPQKVLVYDLGGGTFDVTVIELAPGDVRTLATDGDVHLGGHDWDRRLADHAAEAFKREHREDPRDNPASFQRLMVEVEEAKRTLSARNHATIRIAHAGSTSELRVSRQEFQDLTADLLERTSFTTRQVIAAAGLDWPQIDRVLLVGGSTRMPMVGDLLKQLSGKEPARTINPDETVARGAAIYAGYLLTQRAGRPGFKVTDVNSHSLGIEGIDQKTGRKLNVILIKRNTPLPAKVTDRFVTRTTAQRSINIQVLEGESTAPDQCAQIGQTVIRDLPADLPAGWPIEVTYEYATNGRLSVRAKVPGTHNEVQLELERDSTLSREHMTQWKRVVAREGGLDEFDELIAGALAEARRKQPGAAPAVRKTPTPVGPVPLPRTAPQFAPEAPSAPQPAAAPAPGLAEPPAPLPGPATAADDDLLPPIAVGGPPLVASAAFRGAASSPALSTSFPPAPGGDEMPLGDANSLAAAIGTAAPRRGRSTKAQIINMLGFVLSSFLGLLIGYYILSYLTGRNVWELPLPGLPAAAPAPPATPAAAAEQPKH